jgi:hypothetical protein
MLAIGAVATIACGVGAWLATQRRDELLADPVRVVCSRWAMQAPSRPRGLAQAA